MRPPDNGGARGTPKRPGLDTNSDLADQSGSFVIVSHRAVARARVRAENERLQACRQLHRSASLVRYYGSRPLLAVRLAEYLARGRWAV
jgi:hypothetical protein